MRFIRHEPLSVTLQHAHHDVLQLLDAGKQLEAHSAYQPGLGPVQAFNFAFKDTIKNLFPRYNPKSEFWKFFACNMASGDFQQYACEQFIHALRLMQWSAKTLSCTMHCEDQYAS